MTCENFKSIIILEMRTAQKHTPKKEKKKKKRKYVKKLSYFKSMSVSIFCISVNKRFSTIASFIN